MKKKTVSQLKKRLDIVYSKWLRQQFADEDGFVTCVSCPIKKHWTEMQCGHYISRSHNSLRFDPRNTFVQCVGCNVFKNGNYPAFTAFLINTFGHEYILDLEKEGRNIKQFTTQELESLIMKYKEI